MSSEFKVGDRVMWNLNGPERQVIEIPGPLSDLAKDEVRIAPTGPVGPRTRRMAVKAAELTAITSEEA